ncbi:MAG: HEAT repeat domain-containing protein, partial [Planctomycetota bacterium]
SDGDARVREEAAETLAGYLESPGVRASLTAAMGADADEKVRRQAGRSLEPRGR